MKKVGALWSRIAKQTGKQFITGVLDLNEMPPGDKVNVVVFQNTRKQGAKSPDYLMFLSEPLEQRNAPQGDMFSSPGDSEDFDDADNSPF